MKAYLLRSDSKIMETPQYMLMRVALGIHGNNKPRVLESYNLMSQRYFTHATPTLFNAGTHRPQCSSCFLIAMQEDSITGIYNTLSQCASISKWAGGIGLHVHNIRCNGSRIVGTNGTSSGIVPMLRVFNATARYVDQAGKRKGAFAIFLEPWHGDVFEFLDLRKNHGDEERRCRDLFLGLWIPDLFMRRVQEQGDWSLMDPAAVTRRLGKSLSDVYGEEFDTLYEQLEREGLFMRQVKAQDLWNAILSSQIETGTPYMCYKDAVNRKSNQKNIGVIKSSNLCTEIMEYTDPDEIAVCNLGSICLPRFVRDGEYDFEELRSVTKVLTRNLNRVIDVNFYPVAEAAKSNSRHRPVGLGVQGLADVFAMMRMPFDGPRLGTSTVASSRPFTMRPWRQAWSWPRSSAPTSPSKAARPAKASSARTCGASPPSPPGTGTACGGRSCSTGCATPSSWPPCPPHPPPRSWGSMSASSPSPLTSTAATQRRATSSL
eukprot:TRINITY_DN83_c0_g1_i2.p1 TRINITY_DN83_c0_g1~~TRINITY_DN83_c0_g1_i2.p1  ORF type:complete len:536 (-),score=106.62 TRINITY_DN83_c0_g1_i2:890-2356(-)